MNGEIFELAIGTFKLKTVCHDSGIGIWCEEYVEIYEKVGTDDEYDQFEYIGELPYFYYDADDEDCYDDVARMIETL